MVNSDAIGKYFADRPKVFVNNWKRNFQIISDFAVGIFKFVEKGVSSFFKFIIDSFNSSTKFITKVWRNTWDGISDFFSDIWKGIKKFFTPIINWLSDIISDTVKSISKNWSKTWNGISDFFSDIWKTMKKTGSSAINSIHDTFFDVLGKIGKIFSDTWNGIKNGFSDMWNGMKKIAGDGINAVIKIPNQGIKGINGLIHDFGGPKSAIGMIPEVKFASGTGAFSGNRRAITKPTLAMLNDGYDSPETGNKETLIHPNGAMELVEGINTQRLLLPGTEVLNATETKTIQQMMGISHFADGTGFFSGIWNGIKSGVEKFTKMFGFITDAVSNPVKTLGKVMGLNRSDNHGTVVNEIADNAMFKTTKNQATDWWKELWSMAKDSSNDGASAGNKGDDYPWKNVGKDSGSDPWGYFYRECVSFVASRLKNMGISSSLFSHLGNGADWVNAKVPHTNNPKPGDVAVYAAGSQFGNHVAMVTGVQGDKISGEEYNQDGDGKYHAYHGRSKSGATTFLNFGGHSDSSSTSSSGNTALQKLIKSQVGGMFDWIKKFIAPLNDESTGEDNSVQSWSDDVKRALSKLGLSTSGSMVSKVLRQIQTESGGNAKAIGGNDGLADGNATGLMQVKPGTFRAYALPGHDNIMNGYDNILAGLNYAKARYGSDLSFLGQGHGYANGGLITQHQIAEIGEGNQPEMIIPLSTIKDSRGYELLGRTAATMAARDNISSGNDVENSNKIAILLEQANQTNQQMVQILMAILSQAQLSNEPLSDGVMRNISKGLFDQYGRTFN